MTNGVNGSRALRIGMLLSQVWSHIVELRPEDGNQIMYRKLRMRRVWVAGPVQVIIIGMYADRLRHASLQVACLDYLEPIPTDALQL